MAKFFKVGDVVVQPTLGVCTVEGIKKMVVDGADEIFYIFRSGNTRVLVPKNQLKKRGVRRPITKDEVNRIFTILRTPSSPPPVDKADSHLEYKEIIKTGDPQKISRLLRDLYILDHRDELKGKERELMDQARRFLAEEITFVKGIAKTKSLERINECLKAMYKKKVAKEREKTRGKK